MSLKFFTAALLAVTPLLPAQEPEEVKPTPEALRERVSLALGYQAGMRAKLKRIEKDDVTSSYFTKGFELALKSEPLPYSPEELREAFSLLQEEITKREVLLAEANKTIQKSFLNENAKKEGVTTLKSGLQYLVIEPEEQVTEVEAAKEEVTKEEKKEEEKIVIREVAEVHYQGTLLSGQEFDASEGIKPVSLSFDEVIPGFREAITLMPIGAHWKIFVPSDLGYGDVRRSDLIGPNELLIFEIELISVKARETPEE